MSSRTVEELVSGILRGHRRDLAQAITAVEQDELKADALLSALPPAPGAFRLGLTGAPGVGKSTFISKVVPLLIESGEKVAVLAVDPTSPVTGGALLGDRARMSSDMGDAGWFRSLASRGSTSGVAGCTDHAAEILARAGFGIIIIETVGVGQDEVDIARLAHTTIVVAVPGLGDDIQAMKAGILEVGDLFVVNKADRPDADKTVGYLSNIFKRVPPGAWSPVVLKAQALHHKGIAEIWQAIEAHQSYRASSGSAQVARAQANCEIELRSFLQQAVHQELSKQIDANPEMLKAVKQIVSGETDIYAVTDDILNMLGLSGKALGDNRNSL